MLLQRKAMGDAVTAHKAKSIELFDVRPYVRRRTECSPLGNGCKQ
jgi:hypothetical protein